MKVKKMKSLYNIIKSGRKYVNNTAKKIPVIGDYLTKEIKPKDLGYTLMVPVMAMSLYSCGGSTDECVSPKKVMSIYVNGKYKGETCQLEKECKGELEENNGTYSCKVNPNPKPFECNNDQYHIITQDGINKCINKDEVESVNLDGDKICYKDKVYGGSTSVMSYGETCDEGCGKRGMCFQSGW